MAGLIKVAGCPGIYLVGFVNGEHLRAYVRSASIAVSLDNESYSYRYQVYGKILTVIAVAE